MTNIGHDIASGSSQPAVLDESPVSPSALFVTTVPVTLEAFLTPFARHFRAQGWRIDALANGAAEDGIIAEDFTGRFDAPWSRNPLSLSNLIGGTKAVRSVVDAGAYDIVHVHTPVAAFVTRYALRHRKPTARPAVIYTAHGFHFYEGQSLAPHEFYRGLERLAAPWTDFLVTINREDYAAARRLPGIAEERVRYIPGIGVDTRRFSPHGISDEEAEEVRASVDVAPDEFMLTIVAEFSRVKRHALLLEAMSHVLDPHVVLVLVGDGPLETQLREKAVSLGLARRVRWAGYRRDIPAVLAASDALALVSEREGLNRSVLEAMASGKPVIGTRTRGIADAVGDDAGWIVGKNDPSALAAAIDAAAGDPVELHRRGVAARKRAVGLFSQDKIIVEYEELYREALASRL